MNAFSLKAVAVAVAALLALAAGPVFAGDDADDTVPEILQTQQALRAKLDQPGGEYARLSQSNVSRIHRAQDKVFRMLNGVESLDQLNRGQRTELSNALDDIKAALAGDAGTRMVCHRERRTGTNLVEKRCESVADREARARESQQQMQDVSRTVQTRSGG